MGFGELCLGDLDGRPSSNLYSDSRSDFLMMNIVTTVFSRAKVLGVSFSNAAISPSFPIRKVRKSSANELGWSARQVIGCDRTTPLGIHCG